MASLVGSLACNGCNANIVIYRRRRHKTDVNTWPAYETYLGASPVAYRLVFRRGWRHGEVANGVGLINELIDIGPG